MAPSPRVGLIRLRLSNAYLLMGERPVLVDTGSPGEAPAIVAALRAHGVTPEDLALIVHTHGHVDHAGSTRALQGLSPAPIAVAAPDADLLRRGRNGQVTPSGWLGQVVKLVVDHPFPPVTPDVVWTEEVDLTAYGVAARVLFTPGHTAGSLSVLTAAGELIAGDVLMGGVTNGAFAADRPGYHFFVNDQARLHASLRRLLALKPARWYVGHGGPLSSDAVQAWAAAHQIG